MNRMTKTVLITGVISVMMTATIGAEAAQKRAVPAKPAPRTAPPPAIPATPPKPPAAPYAMRGVALGITLDEWRAIPVIADDGETNLQRYCTEWRGRADKTLSRASTAE